MAKYLCVFLLFSQLAQAESPYYLTTAEQPFYQNDSNGKNDLERIDNDVREINRLWAQVNAMKAEIQSLKDQIAALKESAAAGKAPEKKP